MSKKFDKRIHFITLAVNAGYDCNLANDWYIGEKDRNKTPNDELLKRFTEWVGQEDPMPATSADTESRYQRFVAELTQLTRRYGVAIQSVGGVHIADNAKDFEAVTYVADSSSGDLYPRFHGV